jgi:hypothetical protein
MQLSNVSVSVLIAVPIKGVTSVVSNLNFSASIVCSPDGPFVIQLSGAWRRSGLYQNFTLISQAFDPVEKCFHWDGDTVLSSSRSRPPALRSDRPQTIFNNPLFLPCPEVGTSQAHVLRNLYWPGTAALTGRPGGVH